VLIFFLTFFNWVGIYPGGEPMVTASGWGAAFAGGTADPALRKVPLVKEAVPHDKDKEKEKSNLRENPWAGASLLTIFYLLLLVLAVLPVTLASVILDRVPVKLPPGVEMAMPWRWGIAFAANMILFLFLALQLSLGFQMESNYTEAVNQTVVKTLPADTPDTAAEAARGMALQAARHAFALRLTVLLHLIAIVAAAMMYWVDRRGSGRPLPDLQLRW
jgi:hypothetical protein